MQRTHPREKNNRDFLSSVPKNEETGCDPSSVTINILTSFNNRGIWPVGMKILIVITLQLIDVQISCLFLILHDI